MALILKVGVSRKVSADYQSRGYTLDIQSEFDPRTLDNTGTLAGATDHLFELANQLLDEQVQKAHAHQNPQHNGGGNGRNNNGRNHSYPRQVNDNGHRNGGSDRERVNRRHNGNGNGHNGSGPRPITDAQARAIENMAKRLRIDADDYAAQNFNCSVRELGLRQASDLIDFLKSEFETANQGGNR